MIKTGKSGAVKIKIDAAETVVQKMNGWKLTLKQNIVTTENFGDDGWTTAVPGIKSWDGTIDGSFSIDDPGQKAIQDAIVNGTAISLELFVDEAVTTEKYTGNAYVEELSVDTAPKDLVKISIKFTGDGALTIAS